MTAGTALGIVVCVAVMMGTIMHAQGHSGPGAVQLIVGLIGAVLVVAIGRVRP